MQRGEMRRCFAFEHCLQADYNSAGAFGPDLAKKLAQLVKMEKNVMRSMEVGASFYIHPAIACLRAIANEEAVYKSYQI